MKDGVGPVLLVVHMLSQLKGRVYRVCTGSSDHSRSGSPHKPSFPLHTLGERQVQFLQSVQECVCIYEVGGGGEGISHLHLQRSWAVEA